jgi:hypothetical protein
MLNISPTNRTWSLTALGSPQSIAAGACCHPPSVRLNTSGRRSPFASRLSFSPWTPPERALGNTRKAMQAFGGDDEEARNSTKHGALNADRCDEMR